MSAALPVTVNLDVYRGDTWSQSFRFTRGDDAEDLSGATVQAEARNGGDETVELPVEVDDPANGEVTLRLPAESLAPGKYAYDIEVANAGVVTTWIRGWLHVKRDVTNELP